MFSDWVVVERLKWGHLGGYAEEVLEREEWAITERPKHSDAQLLAKTNTLCTAHIGSAVKRVRQEIELRAAENIIQVLSGEQPQDAINLIEKKP